MSAAFASRWVELPGHVREDADAATLPQGFRAAGIAAGIKPEGLDLGVLVADPHETTSAARFTRSGVLAAPVQVTKERTDLGAIRAVAANSGNANAATGRPGLDEAARMQGAAAMVSGAPAEQVAVCSTGVIGVQLDGEKVVKGLLAARPELRPDGALDFAEAIRTTDALDKHLALDVELPGGTVRLTAQAKGAGMIQPNFATMLCFVQTDAVVADPEAELRRAVAGSFERITVDGQMSTNDTVVLQATGASGEPLPEGLLDAVLLQLALDVVADGEGAERVGRVLVTGAASEEEAERVARAIANSPLVKTALTGRDANWGRIAQAAGQALAGEEMPEPSPRSIEFEELGSELEEVELGIDLGRGEARAHVYFSDLTHEYIRINAEYTT